MPSRKQGIALQSIEGNLAFSKTEVVAWFVLPPQRFYFRADVDRVGVYESGSMRYAELSSRSLHVRTTSMPYPASEWARRLNDLTPEPIDPDAWGDYLVASQRRMQEATTDTKRVYLGVSLTKAFRDRKTVEREAKVVAEIVSGDGLDGVPADAADMEWLLHRSVGLCLPPPERLSAAPDGAWADTDLYQITDSVEHRPDGAFGPTVQVTRYGDETISQHIAVLTLGRIDEIHGVDPRVSPWLSIPDSLPFPVEISARFDVIPGDEGRKDVANIIEHIQDQQSTYAEAGRKAPLALPRQEELAEEIEDEMRRGVPNEATRLRGWVRFAVPGHTAEQAMEHARMLAERYRRVQMDVVHPRGVRAGATQADLIREFIPGEPVRSTAHQRWLKVKYLAAGLPQAASVLGDNRGGYIGYTTGSGRKSVMFDPFYAMEVRDDPGLVPILGGLGAGKTALAGSICHTEILRGASGIIFDPSGKLANLAELPELAPFARHIPLSQAKAGTLNPFSVVLEPRRRDFDTDEEWQDAKELAVSDRKMLALDVLQMLLSPTVRADYKTELLLGEAVDRVEGRPSTPLTLVLDNLDKLAVENEGSENGEHAKLLVGALRRAAALPLSRLFFHTGDGGSAVEDQTRLTILTMPGLKPPPTDVPQDTWSTSERLVVPLLHLAAWYASREIYSKPMHVRKVVFIDEGHFLADWSAGRALFNRLGRDNRKWNTAVLFATHNARDVLGLGEDTGNLVGAAFVGRTRDRAAAAEALRLLDVPTDEGYEQVLAGLNGTDGQAPYREFIMLDTGRNVDKVRIDLQHRPALLKALDTTPKPKKEAA